MVLTVESHRLVVIESNCSCKYYSFVNYKTEKYQSIGHIFTTPISILLACV